MRPLVDCTKVNPEQLRMSHQDHTQESLMASFTGQNLATSMRRDECQRPGKGPGTFLEPEIVAFENRLAKL